ncbi:MAG: type II toxin-antitoxin system PemK/MazF family toxin [Clostridiales bacterium]|nr:type II toxin-antitoxin system PemK/MazF family toxin [Clostridiales bacterium]
MGRKNRRKKERIRSVHVNKYINKKGKTKAVNAETDTMAEMDKQDIDNKPYTDNNPDTRDIKYGDIWFADLGFHAGTSVQDGDRPVLVISNDINNQRSNTVNIIPFTGKMKRLYMPTHVLVELTDETRSREGKKGLDRDSVALAEQITTVSKSSLFSYIGNIGESKVMEDIKKAVRTQLLLDEIS